MVFRWFLPFIQSKMIQLLWSPSVGLIIVIKVEWLWNPLDSFLICFCYHFWTWPYTTFNSIPIILNLLTKRNIALIYSVTIICEQKTKDCAWSGSFQHKLQHRCFQLWCLPAFPASLLYYLWFNNLDENFWIIFRMFLMYTNWRAM